MKSKHKNQIAAADSGESLLWRYFPWIVFFIALAARLIVLWQLSENYHGFDEPSVDSRWHLLWAREIAAGNWLGGGVFYRAPLYPYLLGIIIAVLGSGLFRPSSDRERQSWYSFWGGGCSTEMWGRSPL